MTIAFKSKNCLNSFSYSYMKHKKDAKIQAWVITMICLMCMSSCNEIPNKEEVDRLNDISYSYHYKDIDSTYRYARAAYDLSGDYDDGKAEALNNIAFSIAQAARAACQANCSFASYGADYRKSASLQ